MEKNPALAVAFRRMALGFLVESLAFMVIGFASRVKYILYLRAAQRAV